MSNYHGELMNIPGDPAIEDRESGYREIYKRGHRDARHAAAEQVGIAADRRIAELEATICDLEADKSKLIGEIESLKVESESRLNNGERYYSEYTRIFRERAELEGQVAAAEGLAAALQRLEWSEKRGTTPTCPVCFGMKPPRDGHDNNCQIGQALAAWDAAKEGKR